MEKNFFCPDFFYFLQKKRRVGSFLRERNSAFHNKTITLWCAERKKPRTAGGRRSAAQKSGKRGGPQTAAEGRKAESGAEMIPETISENREKMPEMADKTKMTEQNRNHRNRQAGTTSARVPAGMDASAVQTEPELSGASRKPDPSAAALKNVMIPIREPIRLEPGDLEDFFRYLEDSRRGDGTLESYRRTLLSLYERLPEEKTMNRGTLLDWKEEMLSSGYAVRTVNARISAVNSFLEYRDRRDLQIHPVSAPKNDAVPELTRREYLRLLNTARMLKRERTYFLIKTICCAGVRVQQLSQVTVEAVEAGSAVIRGQCRDQVLHIPPVLREELLAYADRHGIRSGPLFVTRNGSPVNRSNVSDSIRRLCRDAQVPEEKGNPRCLLKLHQTTYRSIRNSVAVLIEQAYDRILEEEQLNAAWDREDR